MLRKMLLAVSALVLTLTAGADDNKSPVKLVDKANRTLQEFLADQNMDWLRDNLGDAKGVMIVPAMVTAGFVIAGTGGDAVLLARNEKTGKWSDPAFYKVGGFSVGVQAGGKVAQVLIMVRSERALQSLMSTTGKIGASGSIAAGPVGGGAASNIRSDMLSFARTKGAFAGISLDGNVVEVYPEYNKEYYGRDITPEEILFDQSVSNPLSSDLKASLSKATK